jgi:glycosyltransferase involved in cell wall biosynthesis
MIPIHLILFLTKGSTLADWHRTGLLTREAELYLRLRPHLASIAWVTYGGQSDLDYQAILPGIDILYNRWRLPNQVYIQQLPWLHRAAFERATILKSEQTGAVEGALRVSEYFGKRLVARSGFSLALFAQYAPQEYETSYADILALERQSFMQAQQVVVTTDEMHQAALENHPIQPDMIRVIPNYVNTQRFAPPASPPQAEKPRLLFIGRLTQQKNVDALLTAVAPLTHTEVDLIGGGEWREHLAQRIAREGLEHVRLLGNIPNDDLPRYLQQATLYLQPSLYEGHPKTIFEAMACGLPVLATDVRGIQQFIQHGVNGWLCQPAAESIRQAIETLLADAELRRRLGQAARQYVESHYALDEVVAQELAMLEEVMQRPAPVAQPTPRPYWESVRTYGARLWRLVKGP